MLKLFSCRLSSANKRAWSAAPLGAERSAKRFCRVVTQTRARIKEQALFRLFLANGRLAGIYAADRGRTTKALDRLKQVWNKHVSIMFQGS